MGLSFLSKIWPLRFLWDLMGGDQVPLLIGVDGLILKKYFLCKQMIWNFCKSLIGRGWKENFRLYCLFELKYSNRFVPGKHPISSCHPWELFSLLDQFSQQPQGIIPQNQVDDSFVLIDMDFSGLIALIQKKKPIRFYWEQFLLTFFLFFYR